MAKWQAEGSFQISDPRSFLSDFSAGRPVEDLSFVKQNWEPEVISKKKKPGETPLSQ